MKNISVFDIAGLVNWKNIQILIKAFNIIVNQYKKTNYYLYVAGDGPYRSELEKMIENYKLQNNVFLLGYQKNVGRLLNSCDIFVHPSFAEGFGIVVPEAMLAQKPVIVSNAGALPELIEHKKTGLIVESHNPEDWANAIIQLAENPEFAEQLAKNAEKSASERFSYNKFCGEYEKLYKKLLKINY
jgi:glycosyltransferase involved in cell wall biosynthesis